MGELRPEYGFSTEKLPAGFKFVPAVIECRFCHRRWRWPDSGGITPANLDHLVDHFIGHERSTKKRKPQQWQRAANRLAEQIARDREDGRELPP